MEEEVIPSSARITPHYPHFPDENSENHAPRGTNSRRREKSQPRSARVKPPSKRSKNPRSNRYRNKSRRKAISPIVTNAPMSPEQARKVYAQFLTYYEYEEIGAFPDIYFVGNPSSKLDLDPDDEFNRGLDDSTNNYKLIVGGHLAYRYEIISLFGAGAFGQVVRCFDHKKKVPVAVKVIVNTDQMHEQGQIEAQILSKLNSKDQHHIVRAYDFFIFRSHICITYEILGMNLYELSESNEFRPLPVRLVRLYALQMFSALEQCHKLGAIHCDIKPENVLLVPGSNALIKLIDFGSSCFQGHQKYEYIQSRFYRAPEVILGIPYGPPMDIWSTSLVIIELLIGRPLLPGDDESEQIAMIAELLGMPPPDILGKAKRREEFFDDNDEFISGEESVNRIPGSMDLAAVLQTSDTYIVDFLMKCLTWDPAKRLTAQQAMQHPWIRMKEVVLPQRVQTHNLPGLKSSRK